MSQTQRKPKRIYLVNRDFQLRYTRIGVVVGLVSTTLTMFLILYPLYYFKIIRSIAFLPTPFLVAIAIAAIFNFFVVAMMGILVTHRIAGPMYALVKHMRHVQLGNFKAQLNVRKDDDLKYLVRNFNDMTEALMAQARADSDRLGVVAKELEKGPTEGRDKFVKEQVEKLRAEIDNRYLADVPIK